MLYVILGKDVCSKEGRLYAKKGKKLRVIFRNATHYVCEVGMFNIPVFPSQVSREITKIEDEEETDIEAIEGEGAEGTGGFGENQGGEEFDYSRN